MRVRQWILNHRLPAFLIVAISLAFILVTISVNVYYATGAYQLDLSRPEYKSVRSKIDPDSKKKEVFGAQGDISEESLDQFLTLYKEEASRVLEAKAFSGDVLSDEQLGI